jgi:hypothetical protein
MNSAHILLIPILALLTWLLLRTTEHSLAQEAKATSDIHQRRLSRKIKRAWKKGSKKAAPPGQVPMLRYRDLSTHLIVCGKREGVEL